MEKLNIKVIKEKEEELEKDPLMIKGTGILGFRIITRVTLLLFLFLSFVSIPIFVIYKNGTES